MRRIAVVLVLALGSGACQDALGPSAAPIVELAGGQPETRDRAVPVRIVATGALEYRLAEDAIDTATFVPYSDTTTIILTPGDGPRTVLAQVRFPFGELSEVARAEIVLSEHVYASPDGSDDNAGSYLLPKRSVGAAIRTASQEGRGRVRLFPGRYAPTTTGDVFPLEPTEGLVLEAAAAERPVLDAEGTAGVLRLAMVDGVAVRGVTLRGGDADLGGGLLAVEASGLIENVHILDNQAAGGSGVFIGSGSEMVIRRSIVASNRTRADADAHGVQVENGGRAVVHNNTIALHDSNGLIVRDSSVIDLRNNVIYGNAGRGICEVSSTHTSVLRYNLFFDNTVAAVLFGGSGDVSGAEVNDLSAGDGTEGNWDADPLLEDPADGDFRFGTGTPTRDAGDPNPFFNDPDGSRNDVGHLGGPSSPGG